MALHREILSIQAERWSVRIDCVTETEGSCRQSAEGHAPRDVVASGESLLTPDWELHAEAA